MVIFMGELLVSGGGVNFCGFLLGPVDPGLFGGFRFEKNPKIEGPPKNPGPQSTFLKKLMCDRVDQLPLFPFINRIQNFMANQPTSP